MVMKINKWINKSLINLNINNQYHTPKDLLANLHLNQTPSHKSNHLPNRQSNKLISKDKKFKITIKNLYSMANTLIKNKKIANLKNHNKVLVK
jgi:hypothetical protein